MTQRRIVHVSRERDEELLMQIRIRAKGGNATSVARKYGVNPGILITATNAVLKADLAESGEPAGIVRRAYW